MSDVPRLWSFRASPFAGKVRVALAEKGVDYELLEIHPVKRPPRLRELNPVGRVPVLEAPGVVLRESAVICEYLEEVYPEPPLWPADPGLRGWARGWARYVDDGLAVNFFFGMRKLAFGKAPEDPDDIVDRIHAKVPRQWARLEDALDAHDGPWLCGQQFTYADITGMAIAVRIPEWKPQLLPDPAEHPRVTAWLAALRERPSAAAIDAAGTKVPA
ncbi:Protein LigF [Paraconexibacter sp. AEG42_29]|uniref:Protein LigF n=1 Tax=Paraconexibacter sp. AEG42_29 TaxID=2997339 RepID=A0AAU7AS61_9ACTN